MRRSGRRRRASGEEGRRKTTVKGGCGLMRRRKNKGGWQRTKTNWRVRNLKGREAHGSFPGERGRDSLHICVQFYGFSKAMDST